jgi:hypothetical protein
MSFHVISCHLRPFLQRPFVISCYLRVFSWFFEPGLSLNLKAALPSGRTVLPRRPNIPPWGARPPARRPVRRSALAKVEALAKEGPGCSFSRPRGKPRAHQYIQCLFGACPLHPKPRPVWCRIALAINPTPPAASNVGLAWISLDSGPDSPQFSSIHLNPARLTWTPPGRAALPRRPNIVFAPNQIQKSDWVGSGWTHPDSETARGARPPRVLFSAPSRKTLFAPEPAAAFLPKA